MNIAKLTSREQPAYMNTILKNIMAFTYSKYYPDFVKEIYRPLSFLATDPHADVWVDNAFTTLIKDFYKDKTLWVVEAYDLTTQFLLVKHYRNLRNKRAKAKESTETNFVELCNTYLNTLSSAAKECLARHLAENPLWLTDYDTAKLILLKGDELACKMGIISTNT